MAFVEYSSIKSEKSGAHIAKVRRTFGDKEFVVTEKIHGANFQFICRLIKTDSSYQWVIRCGKRTAILEDEENFYGWQSVRDRYTPEIEALCQNIYSQDASQDASQPPITTIHVFGELFGGGYPGEMKKSQMKPVQIGIFYSPVVDFMVFDIAVRRSPDSGSSDQTEKASEIKTNTSESVTKIATSDADKTIGTDKASDASDATIEDDEVESDANTEIKIDSNPPKFMSFTDVERYLKDMKTLKTVPLRFRGNFTDALKFSKDNAEFITQIPQMFGLKELENNFAEGNVMKADVATDMGDHRGILKIKHPKFDEIIGHNPKKTKEIGTDSFLEHHKEQLKCYLTQNRLDNVVSKYGPSTPRPKLVGCFLADAKEDYIKTLETDDDELVKFNEIWKTLYRSLIGVCDSFSYP